MLWSSSQKLLNGYSLILLHAMYHNSVITIKADFPYLLPLEYE